MHNAYKQASKTLQSFQISPHQKTSSSASPITYTESEKGKAKASLGQETAQNRGGRRKGTPQTSGQGRRGGRKDGEHSRTHQTRREIVLGQTVRRSQKSGSGGSRLSPTSIAKIGGNVMRSERKIIMDDQNVGIVSNVALKNPLKKMGLESTIKDGKGVFRGSEFLTTISSFSAGPGQGLIWYALMLDPRVWYGTRVRNESLNWERFVLRNLIIEYTSTCPSTTAGSMLGMFSFDPENNITLNPGTTTFRICSSYPEASLINVYNCAAWTWHNIDGSEVYYLQPQQGERFEYPGVFYLCSAGTPTAATQMGNLMIHYEFEFEVPAVETSSIITDGTFASTYTNVAYNQATGTAFSLARALITNAPSATLSYLGIISSHISSAYTYKVPGEDYSIPITSGMVLYFRPNDAGTEYFVYINPSSNTFDDRLLVDNSPGAVNITLGITFYPLD